VTGAANPRRGSALLWAALVLSLLPVLVGLSVDAATVLSAHQVLETALTEAWETLGAPTSAPSPATLSLMTALCREDLPESLQLSSPVEDTPSGLTVSAVAALPIPLPSVHYGEATATLPISWSLP